MKPRKSTGELLAGAIEQGSVTLSRADLLAVLGAAGAELDLADSMHAAQWLPFKSASAGVSSDPVRRQVVVTLALVFEDTPRDSLMASILETGRSSIQVGGATLTLDYTGAGSGAR